MGKITYMPQNRPTQQEINARKAQNKLAGRLEKVERPAKESNVVKRPFVYEGVLYQANETIEVSGRIKEKLFANNYIYG